MSSQPIIVDRSHAVFILAGNSSQYSVARQLLKLSPRQAFWLTRPSDIKGLHAPKVYRFGSWRELQRLTDIQEAMTAVEAEVIDLAE